MSKYWYVDRLEENKVVCENDYGELRTFLKSDFSFGIYEGAVVKEENNGKFSLDKEAENKRREELFKMQQDLFGGD